MLGRVKRFAQTYGVHVWFVAHPRQLPGWKGQAPTLYDISGSSHFVNKADNGIVVHRLWATDSGNKQAPPTAMNQVQIILRKVRNKSAGTTGEAVLEYDRATGRYMDPNIEASPMYRGAAVDNGLPSADVIQQQQQQQRQQQQQQQPQQQQQWEQQWQWQQQQQQQEQQQRQPQQWQQEQQEYNVHAEAVEAVKRLQLEKGIEIPEVQGFPARAENEEEQEMGTDVEDYTGPLGFEEDPRNEEDDFNSWEYER